jgi:hypothetical protein
LAVSEDACRDVLQALDGTLWHQLVARTRLAGQAIRGLARPTMTSALVTV